MAMLRKGHPVQRATNRRFSRLVVLASLLLLGLSGERGQPPWLFSPPPLASEAARGFFSTVTKAVRKQAANGLLGKFDQVQGVFGNATSRPERVLLLFEAGPIPWNPGKENIQGVFARMGLNFQDFDLSFNINNRGKERRIRILDPHDVDLLSEQGDFPEVDVSLKKPSIVDQAKAKAEACSHVVKEWIDGAMRSIVGEKPSESQLAEAEEELANKSTFRLDPPECAVLKQVGYAVKDWPDAVPVIAEELHLTEQETRSLHLASMRDSGEGFFQQPIHEAGRFGLRITSYRTLRVDHKIHLVYGHLRIMGSSQAADGVDGNRVVCNGRRFMVLPEKSPLSMERGEDMEGATVRLPPGAAVVDVSDRDFARIVDEVIKPHGWHADVLLCRSGKEKKWLGYRSARHQGGQFFGDVSYAVETISDTTQLTSFKLKYSWFRILIEVPARVPAPDPRLTLQLTRFGELFARSHWAKQLGIAGAAAEVESIGDGVAASE